MSPEEIRAIIEEILRIYLAETRTLVPENLYRVRFDDLHFTAPAYQTLCSDMTQRINVAAQTQVSLSSAWRLEHFLQPISAFIDDAALLVADGPEKPGGPLFVGPHGSAGAFDEYPRGGDRVVLTPAQPAALRLFGSAGDVPAEPDNAEYTVWYGTNRKPRDSEHPEKGYSGERDTVVHYGSCRVFIPKSHKIGSTGSPWWNRLWRMKDDRLKLRTVAEMPAADYWAQIAAQAAALDPDERDGVVFIHGYNVAFRDAALRTAQIGFDLSIKGPMAFFSWPSRGSIRRYTADEATIEASEGVIADFMTDFARRSGAARLHVIAHSMGNRGVLRAVNAIAATAARRAKKPFDQIILAAADVDIDTFRGLSKAYARVAKRTTLYVSKHDLAVEASRWKHKFDRVGYAPPTQVLPGIDTVSVTNVDLTLLGHGYIAEARAVLGDMYTLMKTGAAPPRFSLREAKNENLDRYWEIGA